MMRTDQGTTTPAFATEPAPHLTVVQAGCLALEQAELIAGLFATPGHVLNGLIGPGVVVEVGRGTDRACLILMSLTDEEALPASVAVVLSRYLNNVFDYAARVYDCDRMVFIDGEPVHEMYFREGRLVLTLERGTIIMNATGVSEDDLFAGNY